MEGLFAINTSANNISYHQQTGSLFSTYPQAAPTAESSDHYPNDDEDCVGGRPRLVEESFGWLTPQTVPFNQVDCDKSTQDSSSQVLPNPKPKLRTADITQTGAGEQ